MLCLPPLRPPTSCRAGLALLLIAGLGGPATAQAPAPRPSAAIAPDPAFEAARTAFEALPESERRGLQDALIWTGDYNSVVAGTFGRRTFEALNAFQARSGGGDPLSPASRTRILAAGEAARRAARFSVRPDPASGAALGVPEALLSKRSPLPGPVPAGTRWQSADGRVTLESRAFPPGAADLDGLFERATAPSPERKVTYKLKRPDFIVVTAETAGGRSYIRYAAGAAGSATAGVRGFTIGYDRALAAEVDRLVIAIANSFVPFPDAAPAPVSGSTQAPPPAPGPSPVARIAGTGLVVAPNRVLTAAAVVEGCAAQIGGRAAKILRSDPAGGLALLEAAGSPNPPTTLALRPEPVADQERLVVLAAGTEGVTAAPATAGAAGLVAPLQPGGAGAPVLDRAGRLAGLVARYPAAPRLVAGVVPPLALPLAGLPGAGSPLAEALAGIGSRAPGTEAPASLGAVAGAVRPAVVAITCVR